MTRLETPQVVASAEQPGRFDGAIAFGCLVGGEIGHSDVVARERARGLIDKSVERQFLIGNDVVTTETNMQARVRSDRQHGDKGKEAATCLAVAAIKVSWVK